MILEFEISVPNPNPTFEIGLPVNIVPGEGGSCPIITEIDGGNSGSDAQFTPINGNLDGGGA
jgi:hypothetical protein